MTMAPIQCNILQAYCAVHVKGQATDKSEDKIHKNIRKEENTHVVAWVLLSNILGATSALTGYKVLPDDYICHTSSCPSDDIGWTYKRE